MAEQPRHLGAAIFLNALVLPGAGHWLAGFTKQGAAMIVAVLLLLFVPLIRFVMSVMELVQQSIAETGMPMRTLEALSTAWHTQRTFSLLCLAAIVLIWIYGIVDLSVRRMRK
jgi:uncharacterized BrkB/YihY/UPF0761 family membrane protein